MRSNPFDADTSSSNPTTDDNKDTTADNKASVADATEKTDTA